ncbi:MAG TPA: pyrroloquinoline quinone biosynthesis protein PqqB [Candidatus Angelobacter sp.]|nr:pyrroloquinoline quinone biosynthesis protein PqqB [Candidatus Angelobacter sp.]
MRVMVLGSAAGGGFPQWNCACSNCSSLRAGSFCGKPRTQTQIAISESGQTWFLLGASPDLRTQIEATHELAPQQGLRHSPISGVVLASGDLDHVVGLLSLREMQPLRIYATASIRRIVYEENSMFGMLNRAPGQTTWTDIAPGTTFSLVGPQGEVSGLRCETLPLQSHYPTYARAESKPYLKLEEALLGLIVEDRAGTRVAYLSAVPAIDDRLLEQLESTDLLFFDGTFWSDDELLRIGGKQRAQDMGHIPISSADGSLQRLSSLRRPRKIFIHINNTNPMLDESGSQYQEMRAAGWEMAEDGWRFRR